MRALSSAIRPRRRRSTNEGGLPKHSSMSMLQRKPSKVLSNGELSANIGRSLTESSVALSAANIGSSESLGELDSDNGHSTLVPLSGNGDNGDEENSIRQRSAGAWPTALYPLYRQSIEEDPHEDAAAAGPEPDTAVQTDAASLSASEPRGRMATYISKLPFGMFGNRRSSGRAPSIGQATGSEQCTERGSEQPWQPDALQTASVAGTKSVVAGSSSSFFGASDSNLLKRVSSVPGNLSLFRAHLTDPLLHPEFRAPPRYTRRQPVRLPVNEPDDTPIYGYALLVLTAVLFVSSMYSLVVSKFMPYTGNAFLDAVKDDRYFCLLMPITGLSFTFAVFWNWLGMKFFRHSH
ncbi:hypothetical protein LPJ63_001978 [Coemansia sp. RSA 2711]|nr:hypothetical protein LPJ63_001978 [Coemansia sp. RSA 2711]